MLAVTNKPFLSFRYDNWGVPDITPGQSYALAGASNSEGTWQQVASSTDIAADVYAFALRVWNIGASGVNKNYLFDVGVDTGGSTSYVAVIENLQAWNCSPSAVCGQGYHFLFPYFIPAGSTVAFRAQSDQGSPTSFYHAFQFFGRNSVPEFFPVGRSSQSIPAAADESNIASASLGTALSEPGAVDTWGAWTALPTTTDKPLWWWQISGSQNTSSMNANIGPAVQLAYGDASNKVLIMEENWATDTTERCGTYYKSNLNIFEAYCPVPAGSTLYARYAQAQLSASLPFYINVVGIGG